jgi:hypothetical protein
MAVANTLAYTTSISATKGFIVQDPEGHDSEHKYTEHRYIWHKRTCFLLLVISSLIKIRSAMRMEIVTAIDMARDITMSAASDVATITATIGNG